ncbi:MAG TPA: hypothetical protein VIU65_08700 [Pyrinomonadaceae bacterium]
MFVRLCRLLVAGLVIVCALSATGCSTSKYDGKWAGTTAQGKEFRFTVSGGAVSSSYLEFDLTCERTGFCPAGGNIEEDLHAKISGNSFSASIEGKATVSGKFDSETAASGELKIEENDARCGKCSENTTWSAKKL